jgi:hypothetical protein
VQSAWAEWLSLPDTVEAMRAASRAVPANADYHARISILDPSDDSELKKALAINPWRASWWISESVREEQDGDTAAAERSLIQANMICQYYTPRWSLAAFYYRQGNRAGLVEWARLALASGYGDSEPMFQMAQRLGVLPDEILSSIVPRDPERIEAYRSFLVQHDDMESAFTAATELLGVGSARNLDAVLGTCQVLFRSGRVDQSVTLWNRAIRAGWMKLKELDPATGISLASTAFDQGFGEAFNWQLADAPGVIASNSEAGGLVLEFSGHEPEACELIGQYVPLLPGRNYQLTIRGKTESIPPDSGLRWSIQAVPSGRRVAGELFGVAGSEITKQDFRFQTSAKQEPLRLSIAYARQPGFVRIEGKLWIQAVELVLQP